MRLGLRHEVTGESEDQKKLGGGGRKAQKGRKENERNKRNGWNKDGP